MKYYSKIIKQKDGNYLVEFPDLPGCLTEGSSLKLAIHHAKEALNGWLSANCDRDLNIPIPKTKKGKNFYPISVQLRVAFAIKLRQLRKKRKLSQAKIAHQLKISQQAYAKLEQPNTTNPSLKTIQNIAKNLGIEVDIKMSF